jgi:hypothetical protein
MYIQNVPRQSSGIQKCVVKAQLVCQPIVPFNTLIDVSYSSTGLNRRMRLEEFLDSQHMKVARWSALHTGLLYPLVLHLILIFVSGWVDPRAIVMGSLEFFFDLILPAAI